MAIPTIAITTGEPAGIGPDITLMAAMREWNARLVAIGDIDMLRERAKLLGLEVQLIEFQPEPKSEPLPSGMLRVLNIPLAQPAIPGQLNPSNAGYVLRMLDEAIDGCLKKRFQAMVTAPVQKSIINDAGIPFSGHTEYLAEKTDTEHVVMMLASGSLRVSLATTHLPLKDVPAAITPESLERTLRILQKALVDSFSIADPTIAVLGLNPHAGEGGHLGREEIDIIAPLIQQLRREGFSLIGPLPADTAFNPENRQRVDAFLAMYHDQGLPVLKFSSFGEAVNITLGLPITRVSVDHGVALDLAGTGNASDSSLIEAIKVGGAACSAAHLER
ncbi:4-hydroxythreonine-4-phosphate dehydrogenase PdxA [Parahaliea mediterranea]|uniref:4-hydroxythreonine-4-phosphate dehydrogenase n=1 Tax=Parahaliea mediterranea TaxID=651086 RepID=A0A939DGS6_9GAMM|nr:4-hydroxythreonine-4-phosphate dehydrogenase PdxA [Parahaliea mediterranea]MBN7797773.1 4-hydroxythreonine-4-phosphate dehydrogenase PdxA [Parahaliea mediterranea]